jgi:hypothetical protein
VDGLDQVRLADADRPFEHGDAGAELQLGALVTAEVTDCQTRDVH